MMLPQEKAEELIERFKKDVIGIDWKYRAINCALFCVEEIIDALSEYDDRNKTHELQNMDNDFRFWYKVERELKKYMPTNYK